MDVKTPDTLTERIMASLPDAKVQTVMRAAFETFLHYGVRRASMQDIADRAGMSRAALYLHFKNKNEIYRALMAAYFAAAADAVSEALAQHPDPVEALRAAFAAQTGDAAEAMFASPHADELFSLKQSAAKDLVAEGHARLAQVYGDWLVAGVAAGRIEPEAAGSDPHLGAAAMLAALDGVKQSAVDWAGFVDGRDRLAQLFGRALRP